MLFCCMNDECDEQIPLKHYHRHMASKCKVQTYTKIEKPVSCYKAPAVNKNRPPPLPIGIGDLNIMFLEKEDKIDPTIDNDNRRYHENL